MKTFFFNVLKTAMSAGFIYILCWGAGEGVRVMLGWGFSPIMANIFVFGLIASGLDLISGEK